MDSLAKKKIDLINQKIYNDYPDYKNVGPRKTVQSDGKTALTYEKKEKTADGTDIKLLLRVTVDNEGKILKVSGSK